MNGSEPWPTNWYSTSWRSLTLWFGWSEEEFIWQALETVGLRRITARFRSKVLVGVEGNGWLEIRELRKIVRSGHDESVVVDPRPDLERVLA